MSTPVTYKTYGMDNVSDPLDVGSPVPKIKRLIFTKSALLENVDPDNNGGCSMRKGQELVYSGIPENGWGNGSDAYFVEGSDLMRFLPNETAVVVRSGITQGRRMVFCQVNDVIAYSNGKECGILEKGIAVDPFVPTDPFKLPMVAGEHIAFYNGRLYALKNLDELPGQSALYCSDSLDTPGGIESMDERFNIVAVFDGLARMLLAGEDGLFVSAGNETFYFPGEDAVVGGFDQRSIAPYGVVPYAYASVPATLLDIEGLTGTACMWVGDQRICIGGKGGFFAEVDDLAIQPGTEGCAILREQNGVAHFLFVLRNIAADAYNVHEEREIDVESTIL